MQCAKKWLLNFPEFSSGLWGLTTHFCGFCFDCTWFASQVFHILSWKTSDNDCGDYRAGAVCSMCGRYYTFPTFFRRRNFSLLDNMLVQGRLNFRKWSWLIFRRLHSTPAPRLPYWTHQCYIPILSPRQGLYSQANIFRLYSQANIIIFPTYPPGR